MKKAYFVICVIALITALTGVPYLSEGITARGLAGVNYGRVIFPVLISGICFWQFKKK